MGTIRSYTSQESVQTGGVPTRASPDAFGAGAASAFGGLAAPIMQVSDVLAQKRRENMVDEASAVVANADYTPRILERKQNSPPSGENFYKDTSADYDVWVDEQLAGITNPRTRRAARQDLMNRKQGVLSTAAQYEAAMSDAWGTKLADDSLLAAQNRVRTNPNDWEIAVADSERAIRLQTDIPRAEQEIMIVEQKQALTRWRFEALGSDAVTSEALDAIEAEINSGDWDDDFDPMDKARILDGLDTARKALNTKADADARAAIDTLTERNNDMVLIDPNEMQRVAAVVAASNNTTLNWELANIQTQQYTYRTEGGLNEAELNARVNAANGGPGIAYPSMPADINSAINATAERTGISAGYLGSTLMREYGQFIPSAGAVSEPDFMPTAVHERVDLRNVNPNVVNAASVAGRIFGAPLQITSGSRTQAQQDSIRSRGDPNRASVAKHSLHTEGTALDISTAGMSQADQARMVDALIQAGFTGFGQYGTHIHADMRENVPSTYGERDGKTWGGWTYLSPEVAAVTQGAGYAAGVSAADLQRGVGYLPTEGVDWGKYNQEGTTSAMGPFQFTAETWMDLVMKPENQALFGVAGLSRDEILELRADPALSTLGAGLLAQGNKKVVEDTLGRNITDAELYMAHFLGAGGAIAFLSAYRSDPAKIAADVMPQAAGANHNVFYDDNGKAYTVGEVYNNVTADFMGAPSRIAYSGNEARQRIIADQKAGLADNPIDYVLSIPNSKWSIGTLDTPESFGQRGEAARSIADYYQVAMEDMKPFTASEAAALGKVIREGTAEDVLGIITSTRGMGTDVAQAAYKQLGIEDPVFEQAARLAMDGSPDVAGDIIRGQRRLTDNPDIKTYFGATSDELNAEFNQTVGKALMGVNDRDAQALRDAVLAHFAETWAARGGGDGTFNQEAQDAYKRSIDAVLGGRGGTPALGSVNGQQTVLPKGMTEADVEAVLDTMTIEDYRMASLDGNPPRYADGTIVDPQDIAEEGQLRAIGTDDYRIQMADGLFLVSDVAANGVAYFTMKLNAEFGEKVLSRPDANAPVAPPGFTPEEEATARGEARQLGITPEEYMGIWQQRRMRTGGMQVAPPEAEAAPEANLNPAGLTAMRPATPEDTERLPPRRGPAILDRIIAADVSKMNAVEIRSDLTTLGSMLESETDPEIRARIQERIQVLMLAQ